MAKDAKRKRDSEAGSSSSKAKLRLDKASVNDIEPVLASFSDFRPPSSTPFTLYHAGSSSKPAMDQRLLLAGESDTIDYVGTNLQLIPPAAPRDALGSDIRRTEKGYNGQYLVGVYDPDTSSVTLRNAPLFTLTRSVKSLNSLTSLIASQQSAGMDWQSRVLARRDLGEAFGNRKTKMKARNEDRMKVDTGNMGDVMRTLNEGIEEGAKGSLDADSVKLAADAARPMPPVNLSATHPQEAYPIDVLIPDSVLEALDVSGLVACETFGDVCKALPNYGGKQSEFLAGRAWESVKKLQSGVKKEEKGKHQTFDDGDDDDDEDKNPSSILKASTSPAATLKLRLVFYVALLWSLRKNSRILARLGSDREGVLEKLKLTGSGGGKDVVLEDLVNRFAERQRGAEQRAQMTSFTETKLLSYSFAICLHLGNFELDASPLAQDLGMPVAKVTELLRSMGCTSTTVKPEPGAPSQRRSVLTTPVTLPKVSRGRAAPKR